MKTHNRNPVTWEYCRRDELDDIWRGTTEVGGEFWAIKKDGFLLDIKMRVAPKKTKIIPINNKYTKSKEFVKSLDRNNTFIMYEKLTNIVRGYIDRNFKIVNLAKDKTARIYGWTIVARIVESEDSCRMEFYSSICSKKDNFCKNIGVYEAFNNPSIYSIVIPKQSFNDNLNVFTNICKGILIPRIEKKSKLRI